MRYTPNAMTKVQNEASRSTVSLTLSLRCFLRRDGNRWSATCPHLGIASQGRTEASAKASLEEAIDGWFETCLDMGTLDAALREAGFSPISASKPRSESESRVQIRRVRKAAEAADRSVALLQSRKQFTLERQVPAFLADALLKSESASCPA